MTLREREETRVGRGRGGGGKGKRFDDESKRCCFYEQVTILLIMIMINSTGQLCVARRGSKR